MGKLRLWEGWRFSRVTQGVMYKQKEENCEDMGRNTSSRSRGLPLITVPSSPASSSLAPHCTPAQRGRGSAGVERSPTPISWLTGAPASTPCPGAPPKGLFTTAQMRALSKLGTSETTWKYSPGCGQRPLRGPSGSQDTCQSPPNPRHPAPRKDRATPVVPRDVGQIHQPGSLLRPRPSLLCDSGQASGPLWASISSSAKRAWWCSLGRGPADFLQYESVPPSLLWSGPGRLVGACGARTRIKGRLPALHPPPTSWPQTAMEQSILFFLCLTTNLSWWGEVGWMGLGWGGATGAEIAGTVWVGSPSMVEGKSRWHGQEELAGSRACTSAGRGCAG